MLFKKKQKKHPRFNFPSAFMVNGGSKCVCVFVHQYLLYVSPEFCQITKGCSEQHALHLNKNSTK